MKRLIAVRSIGSGLVAIGLLGSPGAVFAQDPPQGNLFESGPGEAPKTATGENLKSHRRLTPEFLKRLWESLPNRPLPPLPEGADPYFEPRPPTGDAPLEPPVYAGDDVLNVPPPPVTTAPPEAPRTRLVPDGDGFRMLTPQERAWLRWMPREKIAPPFDTAPESRPVENRNWPFPEPVLPPGLRS